MSSQWQVLEVYNYCENGYFTKKQFYPGLAVQSSPYGTMMVGGATGQEMADGTVELYTFMQLVHKRGNHANPASGEVENVLVRLSISNGKMASATHFEPYADITIADPRFSTHKKFYENPRAQGQPKAYYRIYSGITSVSSTKFFKNGKQQTHVFMVIAECASPQPHAYWCRHGPLMC